MSVCGSISACVLSDLLQKTQLASVKVEFYAGIAKTRHEPVITQPVSVSVDGKKVLVIDDIVDTGESINMVNSILKNQKQKKLKLPRFIVSHGAKQLQITMRKKQTSGLFFHGK